MFNDPATGSKDFISHMVQMKVIITIFRALLDFCFISHMVQMKGNNEVLYKNNSGVLYIPHGSDER